MGVTNLGRVQGGGFYYADYTPSDAESSIRLGRVWLKPNTVKALIGDHVVMADGSLWEITAFSDGEADLVMTLERKTSIRGKKGDTGAQGEAGIGCSINGVPTALDFTSNPQEQINNKVDNSTLNTKVSELQGQIDTKAPLHEQDGDLIARLDKLTGADQYDLNDFDGQNGVLFMRFSRATNAPSPYFTVATMIVCPYTDGWCQQIFCDLLNNDLYIRNKLDGVWQAWKKIATKSSTTSGTLNWRGSSTGEYIKLGSVTIHESGTLLMNVTLADYSGARLGLKAGIPSELYGQANFAESVNNDTSSSPNLAVSIQGTVTAGVVVDIYGKVSIGSVGMVAYYTYTIIN